MLLPRLVRSLDSALTWPPRTAAPAYLLLFLLSLQAAPANAQPDAIGRWTPIGNNWFFEQIHMALLRGDTTLNGPPGSYHSKLLSWGPSGPTPDGKLWGWNPSAASSDNDCSAYPLTQFDSLAFGTLPQNIFCGGHTSLGDGDLLVTGGQDGPVGVGLRHSFRFRANMSAAQQWAPQGLMESGRWYPTNVTLPDGNALAFAGDRFEQGLTFGGTSQPQIANGSATDDLNRLGLNVQGQSLPAIPRSHDPSNWPPAREGHSAVWHPQEGRMIVFGGRKADSTKYLRDTHGLNFYELFSGHVYSWSDFNLSLINAPPGRTRHSAVMRTTGETSMIVYGGIDADGPRSDVWKFKKNPLSGNWEWSEISTWGSQPPGSRYGHAAIYDADNDRMLLFGGRSSTSDPGLADDHVYELDLSTSEWTRLTPLTGDKPSARDGHSFVVDPRLRDSGTLFSDPDTLDQRIVLFGGQEGGGGVRKRDIWVLWINRATGAGNRDIQWVSMGDPSGPSARTRHAAFWDLTAGGPYERMMVSGGDSSGTAIATTWALNAPCSVWTAMPLASPPLAGHTLVHHPTRISSDVPDLYSASGTTWSAQTSGGRVLNNYPFMFVLPSGRLFHAGPSRREPLEPSPGYRSLRYDRTAPSPWSDLGGPTGFDGASAVTYAPGKFMKCGSNEEGTEAVVGTTKKITIVGANDSVTTTGGGWVTSENDMQPRIFPNLTILPNGQVLATGGLENRQRGADSTGAFGVRQPQLWSPDGGASNQGVWSSLLAAEPVRRGYHSTALLLPDGRVISGGGDFPSAPNNGNKPTIFCPPYLFNSGGSLAARPTIYAWSDTVGYGTQFKIWTESPDSILSVCLIRPGAVTHAYNQDQRRVPLTFEVQQPQGLCKEIVADAPANANLAPPGDYLLFIMKQNPTLPTSSGVPAVAQWVRIRSGSTSPIIGYSPPGCGGGDCPFADTRSAAGWKVENSILGRSKDNTLLTDAYRLQYPPADVSGRYQIRIRENEQEETTLDQARLLSVDHEPGTEAFATSEGFVLAKRVPAYRVTTESGVDVTARVSGRGGNFRGQPGNVLLVEMVGPGESWSPAGNLLDRRAVIADDEKMGPSPGSLKPQGTTAASLDADVLENSGILVQVPDGNGGWRTVQHRYPREKLDAAVLEARAARMRLVFLGPHGIGFIGRMVVVRKVTTTEHRLLSARHSRLGDIAGAVVGIGEVTTLAPKDTLALEFEASPASDQVRDFFLLTRGVYRSLPGGNTDGSERPLQFALLQNRPNPFDRTTLIRFDLPVRTEVKLEIFDLLGRRVRTIAEGIHQPGRHAIAWDRKDRRGVTVAPGVYAYRLIAGTFRARKSMVILH
jgi:hypothetical protein